jgi:alpha-tubulin suppressor-like RCC1 family protein
MRKIIPYISIAALILAGFSPACAANGEKFIKISAIGNASYALREDGTVWKWGDNLLLPVNQHGKDIDVDIDVDIDGGTVEISMPDDMSKIRCIESPYSSFTDLGVFALRNDGAFGVISTEQSEEGTVFAVFNASEEMADIKDFEARRSEQRSKRASGMEECYEFCEIAVLRNNGTIWTQPIYDRSQGNKFSFSQLEGLSGIVAISFGDAHALALDENGDVWAWGDNSYGQLGNGFSTQINYPVNIANIYGAVEVVASNDGYMGALKKDGTFLGWEISEMRNRNYMHYSVNELAQSNGPVNRSISGRYGISFQYDPDYTTVGYKKTGGALSERHVTAMLKKDGTVWYKDYAEEEHSLVDGLDEIIEIKASSSRIYALKRDGTLWLLSYANTFTQLENINNIKSFACGHSDILAIKNDGTLASYDHNNEAKQNCPQLSNAISIDAAYFTSEFGPYYYGSYYCVLQNDGAIWIWGDNSNYNLRKTGCDGPSKVSLAKAMYRINDTAMVFDGQECEINPGENIAPILLNGRTFLPIRSLIERFGGIVSWDEADGMVSLTYNNKKIDLWINECRIAVNGESKEIDVPPMLVNSRTFLPLRAIMENFGFTIWWDENTYSVFVDL